MDVNTLEPGLLIPRYLVHSFVYYQMGECLIPDSDYDLLAKRIYSEWDSLTHIHKHHIDKEGLLSGGHQIKYNERIEQAAYQLLRDQQKPTETMGGLTSRNKGKRGEREVVKLLQAAANEVYGYFQLEPPVFERNQMQSTNGGYDIVGLEWLAVEVKFCEVLTQDKWWKQATAQAVAPQLPILIYRKSHAKWRVQMFGFLLVTPKERLKRRVDLDMETFLEWFKYKMASKIKEANITAP